MRSAVLAEEALQQLITAYFLMSSDISENCGQGADSQRIVKRDGDMMLGGAGARQPQMAACLTRDAITDSCQRLRKLRAGVSCRNNFIAHEMQPDQLRRGGFVEMAANRIANLRVQFIKRIGLRKNGLPCRFGYVATLSRVFDNKNDLVH